MGGDVEVDDGNTVGDDDGLPLWGMAGVLLVGARVEVNNSDAVGSTVENIVPVGACEGKGAAREGMGVRRRVGRFALLTDSTVRYTAKFVTSHMILPCV